jgi:hypothetical protein
MMTPAQIMELLWITLNKIMMKNIKMMDFVLGHSRPNEHAQGMESIFSGKEARMLL